MRANRLWMGLLVAVAIGAGGLGWWLGRGPHPQEVAAVPAPAREAAAVPAAPVPEPAAAAGTLVLRRLILATGGAQVEACLRFSAALDPRAEARYADYVALSPAQPVSTRVDGKDLCLGGLAFGTSYRLTLRKGLPAAPGSPTARLASDITLPIALADSTPMVSIAGGGWLLPRQGAASLAVSTVNVGRVRVHVLRVGAEALAASLSGNGGSSISLEAASVTNYELAELLGSTASVVWSGSMDVAQDHNRTVTTGFPLAGIVDTHAPGAYLVIAENAARALPERRFRPGGNEDDNQEFVRLPSQWVVVTDLGITTMSGADGLHAFVRSFASAQPLAGVSLRLLSNGQEALASVVTDAAGQARFAPGLLAGRGANAPHLLAATTAAGDFTLLNLTRPAFDLSDRGVAGRASHAGTQAFLATDRGIYRPGETLHLVGLLRTEAGDAAPSQKVTLILRRPDGMEAHRQTLAAALVGGVYAPFVLSPTAARGTWHIEARLDPTSPPVGEVGFEVQDFVPEQLKVTLAAPVRTLSPGTVFTAMLDGQFLYGAPAAGLAGEGELRVMRDADPVAGLTGWQFGMVDETVEESRQDVEVAAADAEGHAAVTVTPKAPAAGTVPLRAELRAGLFEPGGRIVNDTVALKLRTQQLLIGLRSPGGGELGGAGEGTTQGKFEVRAYTPEGAQAAHPGLHWTLVRENEVFDWAQIGDDWNFHYHIVDEPVASGLVDAGADGSAVVTASLDWGRYRLVVTDPPTGAASSLRVDVGWAETAPGSDTPDKVRVTAETPRLVAGQSTRLHIDGPFAGQALLVLAGDRVFSARVIDVPVGGADVSVTADAAWGPGAYALVSMVRPLDQAARPHSPVRAVGVAWLGMDAAPHRLQVAMGAPAQTLPRHRLAVPVHLTGATGGTAYVSLAAVDEGILQLTRFATPDPIGFLWGQRRLGIDLRDEYGKLLDGSATPGAVHEGGDGDIGGEGLPVTSTRVVSLFAGPVAVDADGDATVAIDIPDFEGRLRLMAVAWNGSATGSAEAPLIVRDPVFADLALPRFLAPGDHAGATASIANTDGPAGRYHLAVRADGPVALEGAATADVTLAAGGRQSVPIGLVGTDVGIGTLTARLSGPHGYHLLRQWQIAVRPPHAPLTTADTARQDPGQVFTADPKAVAGLMPGSVQVSVGYSGFAGIDTVGLLQALDRYPFGCTEQLASAAWPLLYLKDPGLLGRLPTDHAALDRVQAAIQTIQDRQDPAGRFGLWAVGDGQAPPWLQAYTVDFLIHARDAGFAVEEAALGRALANLTQLSQEALDEYDEIFRPTGEQTRAYALFVLAEAGRTDAASLRRMHDTATLDGATGYRLVYWGQRIADNGPAEPLALGQLAGGLALAGDHARAADSFAQAEANLGYVRSGAPGWLDFTYWSYVRDVAGLTALAADSGEPALAQRLIDRLGELPLAAPQLNTQEKAALLSAAHAMNRDVPGRALALNGVAVGDLHLPRAFSPTLGQLRSGYAIANTGTVPMWRTLSVTGVSAGPAVAAANGYSIGKTYLSLDGNPIDPAQLRQNDRLIVVLHGTADDHDDHRTVLTDLLPAGWEIVSAVRTEDEYGFLGGLTHTRVAEARDDRFVAAFDLGPGLTSGFREVDDGKQGPAPLGSGEFRLAYVVRVVTPGRFTLPEAEVEDMYRPLLAARTASAVTEAVRR